MEVDANESGAALRNFLKYFNQMGHGSYQEQIDDFIFTEDEEKAWFEAERDFTKRIATSLDTKQRRRVTFGNKIYI
jgi:hypothetical protein